MPVRIQLSRRKGWRMPPGTVKVDRSTRWGNPFRVGGTVQVEPGGPIACCFSAAEAVEAFRGFLDHPLGAQFRADVVSELNGKNLGCWCVLNTPCHADVLLEIANPEPDQ
jgi:hypothetical protein